VGIFKPKYQVDAKTGYENVPGFVGIYEINRTILPVIEVERRPRNQADFYIIDVKKFAKLELYPPSTPQEKELKLSEEGFMYKVHDLNSDDTLRQEILDKKLDWLEKYPDPEFYLRQKVVLKIFEKFLLRILDPRAAIGIKTSGS